MALSGQSLNGAAATGPGTAITFDKPLKNFSLHFVTTGAPASVSVSLEGSIDGTNFVSLASSSSSG